MSEEYCIKHGTQKGADGICAQCKAEAAAGGTRITHSARHWPKVILPDPATQPPQITRRTLSKGTQSANTDQPDDAQELGDSAEAGDAPAIEAEEVVTEAVSQIEDETAPDNVEEPARNDPPPPPPDPIIDQQAPAPPAPPARTDAEQLAEIKNRVDAGVKLVVFCGFGTAGKSWLMARLLQTLRGYGKKIVVIPDPLWPLPSIEEQIMGVRQQGQSKELFFHDIRGSDGSQICTLVDIVGEQFNDLYRNEFNAAVPTIAALLNAAHIVLTLPADGLLIGRCLADQVTEAINNGTIKPDDIRISRETRARADVEEAARTIRIKLLEDAAEGGDQTKAAELAGLKAAQTQYRVSARQAMLVKEFHGLRTFGDHMNVALQIISAGAQMDAESRARIFEPGYDFRQLHAFRDGQKLRIPGSTYVALTKADTLLPLISSSSKLCAPHKEWGNWPERKAIEDTLESSGWAEGFRTLANDPRLAMVMANQGLFNQLDAWMDIDRVDWVSADWTATGWTTAYNETAPHMGVNWIADWMFDALAGRRAARHDQASFQRIAQLRERLEVAGMRLLGWEQ